MKSMNKKIAFALLALSLIGLAAFAQDTNRTKNEKEVVKYDARDWGVSFNLTGLINSTRLESMSDSYGNPAIQIRKFINQKTAIRAGFGINTFNADVNTVDSVNTTQVTADSSYRRAVVYIAPGMEYHFEGTKRLDPYVGFAVFLGVVSKEKMDVSVSSVDTTGTATLTRNYDLPGGLSFGSSIIIGFNYFISDKLSLGAEYQFGGQMMRTGGDYAIVTVDRPIAGAPTTTRQVGSNRTVDSGIRMTSTAGITLSYFFNR
jgi:hypothetical protein